MWGAFMKRIYLKLICISLSFVVLFAFMIRLVSEDPFLSADTKIRDNSEFKVIIDAGHGGEDGGAVAPDGTPEKFYNLDIALKLEKILKMYGFDVVMTRTEDTMTCDENLDSQRAKKISDIRNRLEIINNNKNAVFVSIHQNNFYDNRQNGTQVFYSHNNPESKVLADSIQNSVINNIQNNNKRVTKQSGTEIYLLYHSQIPSVLVECGFLSNNSDLTLLNNEEYRFKIAMLIADGIINYRFKGDQNGS